MVWLWDLSATLGWARPSGPSRGSWHVLRQTQAGPTWLWRCLHVLHQGHGSVHLCPKGGPACCCHSPDQPQISNRRMTAWALLLPRRRRDCQQVLGRPGCTRTCTQRKPGIPPRKACTDQGAMQDWSEFTDWPFALGVWPVADENVQGCQWAQQVYLTPGAPWQLVGARLCAAHCRASAHVCWAAARLQLHQAPELRAGALAGTQVVGRMEQVQLRVDTCCMQRRSRMVAVGGAEQACTWRGAAAGSC